MCTYIHTNTHQYNTYCVCVSSCADVRPASEIRLIFFLFFFSTLSRHIHRKHEETSFNCCHTGFPVVLLCCTAPEN